MRDFTEHQTPMTPQAERPLRAYYNDNDCHSAAWLRELIKAKLITDGDVDDRSIADAKASDLKGYNRVHFFAGVGGWDYALQLAGWPSDRYVWTGSCPCQPISGAGQRKGEKDERHLWPEFYRLISECKPSVVFGEQVASHDGREWFAGVRADLEALEYAVGGADLCAAGEGAPHIRQRLFWVAESRPFSSAGWGGIGDLGEAPRVVKGETWEWERLRDAPRDGSTSGRLADLQGGNGGLSIQRERRENTEPVRSGENSRVAHAGHDARRAEQRDSLQERSGRLGEPGAGSGVGKPYEQGWPLGMGQRGNDTTSLGAAAGQAFEQTSNYWANSVLIPCGDGKARRIEPGISPLVDGLPGRVGLLRGYGNSIVPEAAAKFIKAYMTSHAIAQAERQR